MYSNMCISWNISYISIHYMLTVTLIFYYLKFINCAYTHALHIGAALEPWYICRGGPPPTNQNKCCGKSGGPQIHRRFP